MKYAIVGPIIRAVVSAIATSRVCISLCLFIQNPSCSYRISSSLVHVTVPLTFTLIGFGENALSAKVEAPGTIEIWVPVDCCAPAADCIGDTIEAIAKLPNVVVNAKCYRNTKGFHNHSPVAKIYSAKKPLICDYISFATAGSCCFLN